MKDYNSSFIKNDKEYSIEEIENEYEPHILKDPQWINLKNNILPGDSIKGVNTISFLSGSAGFSLYRGEQYICGIGLWRS